MDDILCFSLSLKELDAEFVNPFLMALHNTLSSVGNQYANKGELSLMEAETVERDTSVLFRIDGGLRGGVIISMDETTTLRVASAFLMGIPVDKVDDMVLNSLEEFSIRVTERAKIQLIKKGYLTNVTYTVCYRDPLYLVSKTPFLRVPLNTQHGAIEILVNVSKSV